MNAFPPSEMVVVDIAGSAARIQCDDPSKSEVLKGLHFEQSSQYWVKNIGTPDARVELIRALVRVEAVFSEGRDWSPAELVRMFVEQGIVSKPYRTIRWLNPETYQIVEVGAP